MKPSQVGPLSLVCCFSVTLFHSSRFTSRSQPADSLSFFFLCLYLDNCSLEMTDSVLRAVIMFVVRRPTVHW